MFSGHGNDVGADSSISRGLHVHTGLQEKKHTHIFFAFPTALKGFWVLEMTDAIA